MGHFKDKCDVCGQFKYCHGYKNKVVCEDCAKELDTNGRTNQKNTTTRNAKTTQ